MDTSRYNPTPPTQEDVESMVCLVVFCCFVVLLFCFGWFLLFNSVMLLVG